ncbi:hypothetical protein [Oceanivirga miroungae]|uniref:DNA-binding protein n=1 Tax=Oceanivirga miroungae TaxID=1130046 RepID=A0A6I8M809_9FUSO|nr:hypothetical protein [Oceanivirga miroungae]VWL84972.1 hypothetical protein OMES3154_00244 [Oceanivirga miroungae]
MQKKYLTEELTNEQLSCKYANEADMLNVVIFNKIAKEWRKENPNLKGNLRDYLSINELLVLANMENYNAIMIEKNISQKNRMIEIRNQARSQLLSLEELNNRSIKRLDNK